MSTEQAEDVLVSLESLTAKERKKEFQLTAKALKSKDATKRLSALSKCSNAQYFIEGACLPALLQGVQYTKKSAALVQASLQTLVQVLNTAKDGQLDEQLFAALLERAGGEVSFDWLTALLNQSLVAADAWKCVCLMIVLISDRGNGEWLALFQSMQDTTLATMHTYLQQQAAALQDVLHQEGSESPCLAIKAGIEMGLRALKSLHGVEIHALRVLGPISQQLTGFLEDDVCCDLALDCVKQLLRDTEGVQLFESTTLWQALLKLLESWEVHFSTLDPTLIKSSVTQRIGSLNAANELILQAFSTAQNLLDAESAPEVVIKLLDFTRLVCTHNSAPTATGEESADDGAWVWFVCSTCRIAEEMSKYSQNCRNRLLQQDSLEKCVQLLEFPQAYATGMPVSTNDKSKKAAAQAAPQSSQTLTLTDSMLHIRACAEKAVTHLGGLLLMNQNQQHQTDDNEEKAEESKTEEEGEQRPCTEPMGFEWLFRLIQELEAGKKGAPPTKLQLDSIFRTCRVMDNLLRSSDSGEIPDGGACAAHVLQLPQSLCLKLFDALDAGLQAASASEGTPDSTTQNAPGVTLITPIQAMAHISRLLTVVATQIVADGQTAGLDPKLQILAAVLQENIVQDCVILDMRTVAWDCLIVASAQSELRVESAPNTTPPMANLIALITNSAAAFVVADYQQQAQTDATGEQRPVGSTLVAECVIRNCADSIVFAILRRISFDANAASGVTTSKTDLDVLRAVQSAVVRFVNSVAQCSDGVAQLFAALGKPASTCLTHINTTLQYAGKIAAWQPSNTFQLPVLNWTTSEGWVTVAPHLCIAITFIGLLDQPVDCAILPMLYEAIYRCCDGLSCANTQEANSRHTFAAVFLQLSGLLRLFHTMYSESPDDATAMKLCECIVRTGCEREQRYATQDPAAAATPATDGTQIKPGKSKSGQPQATNATTQDPNGGPNQGAWASLLNRCFEIPPLSTTPVSALLLAASFGLEQSVTALVECGADVNGRDAFGRTPLMLASAQGMATAVKALIEAGADINARDAAEFRVLQYSFVAVSSPQLRSAFRATVSTPPLDSEPPNSLFGKPSCAEQLIQAGVEISFECPTSKSFPIHWAAGGTSVPVQSPDGTKIVSLHYRPIDSDERCALIAALAEAGANLDAGNFEKRTPLYLSVLCGDSSIALKLLQLGADPNVADQHNLIPLHALEAHPCEDETRQIIHKALVDAGVGKRIRYAAYDDQRSIIHDNQRFLHDAQALLAATLQATINPGILQGARETRASLLSRQQRL